jgi:hypothetical protein
MSGILIQFALAAVLLIVSLLSDVPVYPAIAALLAFPLMTGLHSLSGFAKIESRVGGWRERHPAR